MEFYPSALKYIIDKSKHFPYDSYKVTWSLFLLYLYHKLSIYNLIILL
ncbi:hypothetical protein XCR1_1400002 [Xenorhabdus cabanillasii JM26]|uniref:Uncharacterized protein n=1 Tax=Xenorhabdus cabanillasii JM26 TaxID=1427517 RepID=W1IR92_9GAMM|nr:hypothetical protein XCR1_1400002 [Xenorhabdus cabanillasii JM26]